MDGYQPMFEEGPRQPGTSGRFIRKVGDAALVDYVLPPGMLPPDNDGEDNYAHLRRPNLSPDIGSIALLPPTEDRELVHA